MLQKHPAFDLSIRRTGSLCRFGPHVKTLNPWVRTWTFLSQKRTSHCYQQYMQRLKVNRASSVKAENFKPRQESNSNGDPTGSIWKNSVGHSASHRGRTPPSTGFGKAVARSFCTTLHHQQQVTTTLLSLSQAALPRQCCGFAGIGGAALSCPCARKWLSLTMGGT